MSKYKHVNLGNTSSLIELRRTGIEVKTVFISVNSWFRGYDPYLKKQSQSVILFLYLGGTAGQVTNWLRDKFFIDK
jgi:hypothetical protein